MPGTPTTHDNIGFVKFKGLELEARAELISDVNLIANASYQQNKTSDGVENGSFAPQTMLKLGARYQNERGLTLAGCE